MKATVAATGFAIGQGVASGVDMWVLNPYWDNVERKYGEVRFKDLLWPMLPFFAAILVGAMLSQTSKKW